jgi:hypothetical protein
VNLRWEQEREGLWYLVEDITHPTYGPAYRYLGQVKRKKKTRGPWFASTDVAYLKSKGCCLGKFATEEEAKAVLWATRRLKGIK